MHELEQRELVVVGGGPAGMEAALAASRLGVQTLLIDERPRLGGQIYRQPPAAFGDGDDANNERAEGARLIGELELSDVDVRLETTVWGAWQQELALVSPHHGATRVSARRIIIAAGAYDRPVAFPGWTLPGVIGAGGAHGLVKTQGVFPGSRLAIAGTGPLALSFAAQLHQAGANVVVVVEAAPRPGVRAVNRLLAAARGNTDLLRDGLRYIAYLTRHRVEYLHSHLISRVEGDEAVERIVLTPVDAEWRVTPGAERSFEVDTLCLGYGFLPSTELTRLYGCRHRYEAETASYVPVRDPMMRTTVAGVFAVGDGAGVAGVAVARLEGRIAGSAAALDLGCVELEHVTNDLARFQAQLARRDRFRRALNEVYRLGPGIYELATPDTIICRCEEVREREITDALEQGHNDVASLKAVTRAGMGYCQGRNCLSHVGALAARTRGEPFENFGPPRARVPVKPITIGSIAAERTQPDPTARDWAIEVSSHRANEK